MTDWPIGTAERQLTFVDLSHPWGHGVPCWPYFEDVKIERLHGMVEGAPLLEQVPLSSFFGTGVVVSIPGWHHHYADSSQYYAYSPGFYKEAGEWFAARGVKAVGTDTQALDHPLATAIGPHGPGAPDGLLPWACAEYEAETAILDPAGRYRIETGEDG
jgi:kynurenine formamidase